MRFPALLPLAAFVGGLAALGPLPGEPGQWLWPGVAALAAAFGLWLRRWDFEAHVFGLVAWMFLGGLAGACERADVPPHHVTRLIASGELDTADPLRWRGTLRGDLVQLPWGFRFEMDLDEVEIAGQPRAVNGGLRASYYLNPERPEAAPALRAGERVEAILRARVPRNFGNPGAFDARAHLARQDVHLTGSLRSTELLRRLEGGRVTLAHLAARARGRLLAQVDTLFAESPNEAAVLRAMLLGDRSFVDHETVEAFQKTAVYHVLVISGLHVAALAAFIVWSGRRLGLPLWLITLATLAVLLAFVLIVEDKPPILRAALMAAVMLAAMLLFRRVEVLNTIAVAALAILVARPPALEDPSFQLSFLAAGMIGALGLPWVRRTSTPYRAALAHLGDVTRDAAHPPRAAQFRLDLRALAGWLAGKLPARLASRAPTLVTAPASVALRLWEVFVISSAIQLGMLALMAYYFHRVILAGPLANIPGAILSALLIPAGYITLAAAAAWPALGGLFVAITRFITTALLESVEWFSAWGWGSYRIPGPPVWLLVAFFATIGLLSLAAHREKGRRWQLALAGVVAFLSLGVATHPFAPQLEPGQLEMTLLDVGQGDAIFIAFPDGRTMLLDGGGTYGAARRGGFRTGLDIGEQVVSPYLWLRGLKRLDVVALTHAHQDHLDGLNAVLENFRVSELWVGREVRIPAFERLLATARGRGVTVRTKRRGEHFEMGGVTSLILWPEESIPATEASNDDSLVLRLEHGEAAFLLPGDIERSVEQELVARGDPLAADFLKVPHHGSRTSTTALLADAVAPRAAAISVGEGNPFGHPHGEVLERLRAPGRRILRTDADGAVTVRSDGRAIHVETLRRDDKRR